MFEKATRLKIRFETARGHLQVEDLWDLPLVSNTNKVCLDDIAKELYKQLKDTTEVSFVVQTHKKDDVLQLKFDIVKHVIDVRLVENAASTLARENKEKKQRLLEIIAQKENENLMGSSLDELKAMVAAM